MSDHRRSHSCCDSYSRSVGFPEISSSCRAGDEHAHRLPQSPLKAMLSAHQPLGLSLRLPARALRRCSSAQDWQSSSLSSPTELDIRSSVESEPISVPMSRLAAILVCQHSAAASFAVQRLCATCHVWCTHVIDCILLGQCSRFSSCRAGSSRQLTCAEALDTDSTDDERSQCMNLPLGQASPGLPAVAEDGPLQLLESRMLRVRV